MYKLSRRRNLIPFIALMAAGMAACMLIPQGFTDNVFEIPAFALLPAEVALVMMLSVLFFENASPAELLRISFTMIALCMFAGGMGNIIGKTTQTLPDQTLLLNWFQLILMNITGLVGTIAFYQTKSSAETSITKIAPVREAPPPKTAEQTMDEAIIKMEMDAASGESVQDILSKLDVARINTLESSLKKNEPANANVSLESLFADENAASQPFAEIETITEVQEALSNGASEILPAPLETSKIELNDARVETVLIEALKPENKLFNDVSNDLEDIFSDLAFGASNDELTAEKLAEVKASTPPPAPAPVEEKHDTKLIDVSDDDIDDIFANIVSEDTNSHIGDMLEELAPPIPQPAPGPIDSTPKEVKEFGRLSSVATSKTDPTSPGTLKTIGQMLLDTHAIENIIKHSEGRDLGKVQSGGVARVVTVSRGADIQAMMEKIAEFPGLDGCLVIGKDGLLIGATAGIGMMRDVYGVLSLGMHSTTNLGTKKVDLGELKQSILRTGNKLTIMTEIGIGVLAAFSDDWEMIKIDALVDHIAQTVNESQASGGTLPTESLSGGMLAQEPKAPPVTPPPVVVPQGDSVVPITEMKGGLLSVDDDDIGGLFDNVLAETATHNDSIGQIVEEIAKPLLSVSDGDMGDIFDNLLDKAQSTVDHSMDFTPPELADKATKSLFDEDWTEEADAVKAADTPAAPTPPAEAPQAISPPVTPPVVAVVEEAAVVEKKAPPPGAPGQQIKEFGRLSASTASTPLHEKEGAIKAIGRQLIDVQAIENIIKSGEKREKMGAGMTTARVISQARGEGIKALLTKIDQCAGVAGSLIVGNDGLVIASTLTGGMDKDLLGALCSAMYSHTDLGGKKLQMGKLKQIIFHAVDKTTVLTPVAVGVLAVFVENHELDQIDSLLTAIEGTVRG